MDIRRYTERSTDLILITGGTGTLGKALVKRLKADKIIVYSRDEYKQSVMARTAPDNVRFFLGDVRDLTRLKYVTRGVETVIHAAALKQVPALEYNPTEAVRTNVMGTQNVIEACLENGVKKAIFISTDKAVEPINLYGATKMTGEKLWMAANAFNSTKFSCVRYGNVIGSRGSVIELFRLLKEKGVKEFPITNPEMTRFWLRVWDAVELVKIAIHNNIVNIFVPRLKSCKITDIARTIEPECTFKIIGTRPGEKVHETLVSASETVALVCADSPIESSGAYTSDMAERFTEKEIKGFL